MYNFDNFIFDMDGTLVNSSQEVINCFDKAFTKANYNIDKNRLTSDIIGPPLKGIVKLIAPELSDETKIAEIIENFRELYDYSENDVSFLYDGVLDLLKQLKNNNKKIFIATFKPTTPALRIAKIFNIENFFDDIYTIDKFGEHITKEEMILDILKKYNLQKEKTVMIGDAPNDVKAARNTQVASIGALWGYGNDKTELLKHSDYTAKNIKELENLL